MTSFRLTVQRIDQHCLFELAWNQGQRLTAQMRFPAQLMQRYIDWQQAYRSFYQTVQIPLTPPEISPEISPEPPDVKGLRGKVVGSGSLVATPKDWRIKLVEAESRLMHDFHQWLRSPELYDIRAQIAQASRVADGAPVDIFLTCSPTEVARLPWEAWEIGSEFAAGGSIRIARTPTNIRAAAATRTTRRRPRILAILGDSTGLDFKGDREAVQALAAQAEVVFVGWQPGVEVETLKQNIVTAIADEQGWDILFFAGHSNEKAGLGGELAIAPNTAVALSEIQPHLEVAQRQGLKFAIFNSCSGMDIAATLINIGLSQVAVMREPIHNRVAQTFLLRFLQSLTACQDVHQALIAAAEFLKTKTNLTHPSAHLVPALFRHPESTLFQLQPTGWKQRLQRFMPSRTEAIAVALLAALSWQLPVQSWLLERRMAVQAVYRHATRQFEAEQAPPVLLVQIDDTSIAKAEIRSLEVMDRTYLAQLVDQLVALDAQVIGLDYLLDYRRDGDEQLAQALQAAVDQDVELVFAATRSRNNDWLFASSAIAQPEWAVHGDIRQPLLGKTYYLKLLPADPTQPQPLGYELAKRHPVQSTEPAPIYPSAISRLGYPLQQMWFRPLVDFSLPPQQFYQRIPAWELLGVNTDDKTAELQALPHQVAMIVPGGYENAGIHEDGQDNRPVPAAVAYWRRQSIPLDTRPILTGGEVHAYQLNHHLDNRFVVPIPDLWMVGLAALLGKGLAIALLRQRSSRAGARPPGQRRLFWLIGGGSAAYMALSLQLYVSVAIVLPIVLPMLAVLTHTVPPLIRKKT